MDCLINRDAEMAMIGLAMQDYGCAVQLAALPESIFAGADMQKLHRALQRCMADNVTPELITLASEAGKEIANPEPLLIACMQAGFSPAMYGQYLVILDDCRKRRAMKAQGANLISAANDPSSKPDKAVELACEALRSGQTTNTSVKANEAVVRLLDSFNEARQNRCFTGIADLDRITGGIRGGKLIILGARPGVGKTALGLQIAHHVATHGAPVLIVSLEMDEVEIMSRIAAAESGVNVERLESGMITEEDQDALTAKFGELCQLPMQIATRANTPALIRREAVSMQHNGGLGMIMVDYIQLLHSSGKSTSRYDEVSSISRDLKQLAMELGVPVLALTQFNRQSEGGVGGKAERRKPQMSESKESGSIEQDANLFLTLWEPPEPAPEQDAWWRGDWNADMAFMELSIEKNRQGRTGSIPLAFDKPHMRFHNLTQEAR